MNITFGSIDKRANSTKTTFASDTTITLDCTLKESCSRHDPVFIVKGLSKSRHYNYLEWQVSDSKTYYYWIQDIIYVTNEIQEVHCKLDPLGTFKSAITATNAFVKYSSIEANWNKEVDDIRWNPEKQNSTAIATSVDLFEGLEISQSGAGSVVFRVLEAYDGSHKGINTYVVTPSEFSSMLRDISGYFENFAPLNPSATTEGALWDILQCFSKIWGALAGTGSWSDNLLSCLWTPVPKSKFSGEGAPDGFICFGSVPCPCGAVRIDPIEVQEFSKVINIGWSQQSLDLPFLKNPRFTSFQVSAPGGYTMINSSSIKNDRTLILRSAINLSSGQWNAIIQEVEIKDGSTNRTQRLASFGGCVAVDLRSFIGQSIPIENQGPKIGFRLASDILTYGTSEVINGVGGAYNNSGIDTGGASGASNGDITALFVGATNEFGKVTLYPIQFEPKNISTYESYCGMYGFPCNKYMSIPNSGFVQCVGASISPQGAIPSDIEYINACVNNGIYIE